MKKKIIIIIVLVTLIALGLLIPNQTFKNLFKNEDKVNYIDSCFVYLLNDEEELVGITVPLTEEVTDEFQTMWNILTVDVPDNYHSPIYFSTQVIQYEVNGEEMLLNVSEDLLLNTSRKTLECLVYNFCVDDVKKINLQINNEKVNEFDGIHFDYLSKDLGVNLTFEDVDVLNCNYVTMIYEYQNYVHPVTYFVNNDTEIITYVVKKSLLMSSEVSVAELEDVVSYEITDNVLNINVSSFDSFDQQVLNTIASTIDVNYDFTQVIINGLELVSK